MRDSAKVAQHVALVIGFKELWEGCGNKYPIIMWCDNQEVDSCSHRRLEVISDIDAKDSSPVV